MELFQVDDVGRLFISPAISDWEAVTRHQVDTIIDLDGELDEGVPTVPNQCLYIYFPIFDEDLPNLEKLHAIGISERGLSPLATRFSRICGMGFNRSALVAGLILYKLGMAPLWWNGCANAVPAHYSTIVLRIICGP
jgi:hypothetical protein